MRERCVRNDGWKMQKLPRYSALLSVIATRPQISNVARIGCICIITHQFLFDLFDAR